ncbi:hypothetical protein [Dyadobacter sediminis]|uniref:Uncharacterized protein n=1 Tax=Dyadobacter sediminis TaxID=1493691 RepID=A0A5R9K7G5_9BACT|nr:hypothetical protein [Dyadobacter sediminis]TLU89815.1 hypothetical protein FEM55_19970 [Dyadobacter sediminis]GGC12574.1 hypothetical protein GCM10011325_44300 [Dyadobacter sediminis]
MFWFKAGVIINSIGIFLVIANAVYDTLTLNEKYNNHNGVLNFIGLVLIIVITTAFSLKLTGKLLTANIILWIPAAPLLLFLTFTTLYMMVIAFSKNKNWH